MFMAYIFILPLTTQATALNEKLKTAAIFRLLPMC